MWVIWVSGSLFWVTGGEWGFMGHYFGWLELGGALFCVSGVEWENILGRWGWLEMSGGGWG